MQLEERVPELIDQRLPPEEAVRVLLAERLQAPIGIGAERRFGRARSRRSLDASGVPGSDRRLRPPPLLVPDEQRPRDRARELLRRVERGHHQLGHHLAAQRLLPFEGLVGFAQARRDQKLVRRQEHQPRQPRRARGPVLELGERDGLARRTAAVVVAHQPDEQLALPDQPGADLLGARGPRAEILHLDQREPRQPIDRPMHRLAIRLEVAAGRAEEHFVHRRRGTLRPSRHASVKLRRHDSPGCADGSATAGRARGGACLARTRACPSRPS